MEDNVSESIQTNVLGTKNIADLAVKYNAEKFVMISTDKAVNPTNIMGCSLNDWPRFMFSRWPRN